MNHSLELNFPYFPGRHGLNSKERGLTRTPPNRHGPRSSLSSLQKARLGKVFLSGNPLGGQLNFSGASVLSTGHVKFNKTPKSLQIPLANPLVFTMPPNCKLSIENPN